MRSSNRNWYWRRSGVEVPHQGRLRSNAWEGNQPNEVVACAMFTLSASQRNLRNRMWDIPCSTKYDITVCEIPYVT